MTDNIDKSKCSGCKACLNACPVEAITFADDEEGIWYPKVDENKCIQCGLCEKVCPINNDSHGVPECNQLFMTKYYAAQLINKADLDRVSSGGAFQGFAQSIISNGGIVYGAAQENVDHIYHLRITSMQDLEDIRRSKYFQSDIGKCYFLAKKDLLEGKTVLFSGTGCQIAGLNCYLEKVYNNLYTCEVVCHGVPSRKIWKLYRNEKEAREGKRIVDLVFRDKSKGWSNNQYKITYDDGSKEFEKSTVQLFHAGYLQGLFYRPSCGSCTFASMPRAADITLADYWKYQGPLNEEDIGVSLVAVNNSHGEELLIKSAEYLSIESTSAELALSSCKHMDEHPEENPYRNAFITKALSEGYYAAAREYIQIQSNSIMQRLKNKIKSIIWR